MGLYALLEEKLGVGIERLSWISTPCWHSQNGGHLCVLSLGLSSRRKVFVPPEVPAPGPPGP